ncbi:MAG: 5-formyltetrahydrofolate cyclo-ligase [Bacteroidota bacterium]
MNIFGDLLLQEEMPVVEQKKLLRKEMFAKRNALDAILKNKYDRWIAEQLQRLIAERNYKTVHTYIPMGSEIDIRPVINFMLHSGITVISPKTLPKHQLENRILVSLDDLATGIMGTQHPREATVYEGLFDLIIVPGLAIDVNNYRLGYGGGYYDTFLAKQQDAHTVGIYYPFQQVEHVPIESHDLKLDAVLIPVDSGFVSSDESFLT